MSNAAAPTPAVFFAASPSTASGFQALKPSHPAHPSRHRFADDISARNYERELQSRPLPDGSAPIVLITGENYHDRIAIIRAMIDIKHAARHPQQLIAGSENMFRAFIQAARESEESFIWFLADKFHSHALAIFAAQNPCMRIYCSAPRPNISPSINRLARIIRLAS